MQKLIGLLCCYRNAPLESAIATRMADDLAIRVGEISSTISFSVLHFRVTQVYNEVDTRLHGHSRVWLLSGLICSKRT